MAVVISSVQQGSPAEQLNIPAGSKLLRINGEVISDVLDYGFYSAAAELTLDFELPSGEKRSFSLHKSEYEELGFMSDSFLMDKEHACRNSCIFCFIDQNPHGMRPSIYFKDDDERLSFLFGSYVTLTNLTDEDVQRIIKMKISPVNVSVHTTDKALRCKMMGNRFAGDTLRHLHTLAEAGTDINCQIVVCRGYNDGEKLSETIHDLLALYPAVGSISVVPVGLTKHREGLTPLLGFDKSSAKEVLDLVRPFARYCRAQYGDDIVYCSDELYLMAGEPLPSADEYGDYKQLENGVGMCSLLEDEFVSALQFEDGSDEPITANIATGALAFDVLAQICERAKEKFPNLKVNIYKIINDFYGSSITVAGLLTGQDIANQLADKNIQGRLLLSETMLRREGDLFLDDMSRTELEQALGVEIRTVSDGGDLLDALLGR